MDELGEIMAAVAVIWFVCDGDRAQTWPYCLGVFILGAALYFMDRAISRPRR